MKVKTKGFPVNSRFEAEVQTGDKKSPVAFIVGNTGEDGECELDIPDADVKIIEEVGIIDFKVFPKVPVDTIKIKVQLLDGELRTPREMGPCYTMGSPQRKDDKVLIGALKSLLLTCKLVAAGKEWRSTMDADIDVVEGHLKRLGWRD